MSEERALAILGELMSQPEETVALLKVGHAVGLTVAGSPDQPDVLLGISDMSWREVAALCFAGMGEALQRAAADEN